MLHSEFQIKGVVIGKAGPGKQTLLKKPIVMDVLSNLDGNLKVIGPMGSGKTIILKNIALGLEEVLVIDTDGEYVELEKQTNKVKVIALERKNALNGSIECEISEELMKLAEKYKYIIVDEPLHINRDQLNLFIEHMKDTTSKIITTFITPYQRVFIEDELTKQFPYTISMEQK
ncbi:ATP-binding protein [Bacillus cytotoxicus]|uniref:ATP-binding protein n=1 Tax=Bacillus cytotoxicus TaxID=580165 RepID=A0ACC6A6I1_9BACI|nr:ATP-binding protein [Bacillus cytotoxicus]